MTADEQEQLIQQAQEWFRKTILPKHLQNTRKLKNPKKFDVNPFLAPYLAVYLTGELTPQSVAKALVYPRVLGSSITTSFGQNMEAFISEVLKNSFGSTTQGIDIEFVDCVDGRKKYCQVKLGPNTINKDDVTTVVGHFKTVRNLGRTNNVSVRHDDMLVGILYGEPGQESSHYKTISTKHDYPVVIGQEFWLRLTGSKDFYQRLIRAISDVALEAKGTQVLDEVVSALAASDAVKTLAKKV